MVKHIFVFDQNWFSPDAETADVIDHLNWSYACRSLTFIWSKKVRPATFSRDFSCDRSRQLQTVTVFETLARPDRIRRGDNGRPGPFDTPARCRRPSSNQLSEPKAAAVRPSADGFSALDLLIRVSF